MGKAFTVHKLKNKNILEYAMTILPLTARSPSSLAARVFISSPGRMLGIHKQMQCTHTAFNLFLFNDFYKVY